MTLETLSDAQRRLSDSGFVADLQIAGVLLRNASGGGEYLPDELQIVELVRFEGASDPADAAALFALATRDGLPVGTLATAFGPSASAEEGDMMRRLHRVVATPEDMAFHSAHDHVAAVLPDAAAAEVAVAELREVGLGSEHLGLALHQGQHVVFERDDEEDYRHDVGEGMATGAALGFLAGMLLFAVAVPGIGTLGAGGIAAASGGAGFGGAMVGGFLGVGKASEEFRSHTSLREKTLGPDEVLVVACAHNHRDLVESALLRHGGRLIAATPRDLQM